MLPSACPIVTLSRCPVDRHFREAMSKAVSWEVELLLLAVFKFSDALSGLSWASVCGAKMNQVSLNGRRALRI